ncbi:MAG: MBL fold metallo-hydrolase, partial [Candidatus Nealsonbacteria bacterium]|nr:MBL fold metallo-hydrolase [Candidatus Nealsonbacteria bacterium]
TFRDGENIKNGGIDIEIIFFPRHTPDEVAFYVIQEKILITGDLIKVPKDKKSYGQTPFIPVFNSPYSSFEDAMSSLKKISDLDVETLMPGHRQQITGEKLIKSCLVQMEEEMVKKKRLVANLKNRGMADAEILKYVIRDISKSYPNCSQTDQMFYAYLLLKSSV